MVEKIFGIMRNDDMLLLEAQIVDRDKFSKEMLHQTARDEYNSDAFREFAQSALLQYTNLAVDFIDAKSHYIDAYDDDDNYFKDNYSKSGDPVLGDPVLTVDCYQINNTDTPMKIKAFPQRGE